MAEGHQQAGPYPASFGPSEPAANGPDNVSVVGVLLLSTFSVGMAIIGMLVLGLVVMALWWLVSHIPIPPGIRHLLALL
jgi:hypothetical protein